MAKKAQTGLGRGFLDLYADNMPASKAEEVTTIKVSNVEPRSNQPRKDFEREPMEALADSVNKYGVLQPILVRENPFSPDHYEIIAGERRWRAARMAGLNDIPAIILSGDDMKMAEIALIENIQREDLNPVEEALAYEELMTKFDLTQEEVASKVNRNRSTVANLLRLLELPDDVLAMLREKTLSMGHARALLGLEDKTKISELAQKVVSRGLSVREVENTVRLFNANANRGQVEEAEDSPDEMMQKYQLRDIESKARGILGRKLRIVKSAKKHTVEISYSDDADLEKLLRTICGDAVFGEEE